MGTLPSLRSNNENRDPRELNLVPYLDIVTNIIMFMLVTTTTLGTVGIINVTSPRGVPGPAAGRGLDLTVVVRDDGFAISTNGGGGPSVPLTADPAACRRMGRDDAAPCHDFDALTRQMAEVKKAFPGETRVRISAADHLPYDLIVGTMDAARENRFERDENGRAAPLFYDVVLAAGPRD